MNIGQVFCIGVNSLLIYVDETLNFFLEFHLNGTVASLMFKTNAKIYVIFWFLWFPCFAVVM